MVLVLTTFVLVSLSLYHATAHTNVIAMLCLQIRGIYPDVKISTLYDVLHDPVYRKEWDPSILDGEEICRIDANNDIGYYASMCVSMCGLHGACENLLVCRFLSREG